MASITKRSDGVWRARYRDETGKEHTRHFPRKVDGQRWLAEITTSVVTGAYVDPKTAKTTVRQWCDAWLVGYATRRASTVSQARVHIKLIVKAFGPMTLSAVRPSHVKSWTAQLKAEGRAPSYVYALHRRLSQVMSDAVHDGILARNPCTRRTSPPGGSQRPYVATTEQIWALYDAMPDELRVSILLGAFAGLRLAEAAALRVDDVDFMRGIVSPAIQWPAEPLKTETSRTPVPIPQELALMLSAAVAAGDGTTILRNEWGQPAAPWVIQRAMRSVRTKVPELPTGFRFQDLRHYYASLLIASGLDVKVVQARMRHSSANTTLNTYGHLWPDRDESARAAIGTVIAARAEFLRTSCGLDHDHKPVTCGNA